jgi:hypothetical protein
MPVTLEFKVRDRYTYRTNGELSRIELRLAPPRSNDGFKVDLRGEDLALGQSLNLGDSVFVTLNASDPRLDQAQAAEEPETAIQFIAGGFGGKNMPDDARALAQAVEALRQAERRLMEAVLHGDPEAETSTRVPVFIGQGEEADPLDDRVAKIADYIELGFFDLHPQITVRLLEFAGEKELADAIRPACLMGN